MILLFCLFKCEVQNVLSQAAGAAGYNISPKNINCEFSEHADTSSKIAFQLAPALKKSPASIASELVQYISLSPDSLIGKIEASGPYINAYVSDVYIQKTLKRILEEKENYGQGSRRGKIILEHTSANPNGPLHVGHIRNSVIGDTLCRILKKTGYDVEVQYYVNDTGRQIAVVSWACDHYPPDPTKKSDNAIADVYIRANKDIEKDDSINASIENLMKEVESGNPKAIESFTKSVDMALSGIRETLKLMNVSHDTFIRESTFIENGDVWRIIESLEKTGRTKEKDGALVVDLSDYGFEKMLVIRRSNGTSLYTTRDIAYHQWKSSRCDRMINIFGADHKLIAGQLCSVLDVLGYPAPELVIFEFVSLPEGSMSTRRGKFIPADDLLHEVISKAYEEVEMRRPETSEQFKRKTAKSVGVGAVRYDIIRVSPEKSTVFDWKKALDFEKQGAPYIQYAHARAAGILQKAREQGFISEKLSNLPKDSSFSFNLAESYETDLIKKMSRFQEIIETCADDLRPHTFAVYARELADVFNQFYRFVPVLNENNSDIKKSRLYLVLASKIVLKNALEVLGIDAPDSM